MLKVDSDLGFAGFTLKAKEKPESCVSVFTENLERKKKSLNNIIVT